MLRSAVAVSVSEDIPELKEQIRTGIRDDDTGIYRAFETKKTPAGVFLGNVICVEKTKIVLLTLCHFNFSGDKSLQVF